MCAEVVQTAPNRLMTVLLNAGRNSERGNVSASVFSSRINVRAGGRGLKETAIEEQGHA